MTTFNKNCVINVIKYNISIELSRILSYTIWCNFLIGNVLSWECRLTLLPRTIIVTQITKLRTKTVGDILLSKDTFQNLEFWHVFFMKQVLGGSWHDITWKKKAFKELVFSKQLFSDLVARCWGAQSEDVSVFRRFGQVARAVGESEQWCLICAGITDHLYMRNELWGFSPRHTNVSIPGNPLSDSIRQFLVKMPLISYICTKEQDWKVKMLFWSKTAI